MNGGSVLKYCQKYKFNLLIYIKPMKEIEIKIKMIFGLLDDSLFFLDQNVLSSFMFSLRIKISHRVSGIFH